MSTPYPGRIYATATVLGMPSAVKPLRMAEVVLVFRPLCSPVKVDQGFISGCHSHRLCFARIGLVGGQDAMGRVRLFGIVIGQPFSDAAAGL
jgi:hypothetical protein